MNLCLKSQTKSIKLNWLIEHKSTYECFNA